VPFDGAMRAEPGTYVERLLWDHGIPGASIVIVQGGKVVDAGGYGVTEAGGARVDADTRMRIGSATKTMTTMMAATKVDDGTLTWDPPFARGAISLDGPNLVLSLGTESYVFVRLDAAGTPVASPRVETPVEGTPEASPVAAEIGAAEARQPIRTPRTSEHGRAERPSLRPGLRSSTRPPTRAGC